MPVAHPSRSLVAETAAVAVVLLLVLAGAAGLLPVPASVVPAAVVAATVATVRLRRLTRLAAREARFRALVHGGPDLVVLLDEGLRVRWRSPHAAGLFGLADGDVLGRPFAALLHPDDAPPVEAGLAAVRSGQRTGLLTARLRDGRGVWRETESTVSDLRHVPEVAALVLHVRDVGERRGRTARRLAEVDQLTGLANDRALRRALTARRSGPQPTTLLVLDLRGRPQPQSVAGPRSAPGPLADLPHRPREAGGPQPLGDHVLVEVARRLRATTDPGDLVARLSGGGFAVVTAGGTVLAYGLATRLLGALTEPYPLPGGQLRPEVTIGLADTAGGGPDDVLGQAELARRRAGQLGGNRIEWYDVFLEEQRVRRIDLERELPGAVARGELDLVYQPVLRLADRLPVGAEALLRWRSPLLGTVLPAELLPVATDLGLLGEVGQWVRERACRQLAAWSAVNPGLWMAVNVAPTELTAADFVPRLAALLSSSGVPAERLVVEVAAAGVEVDPPTVVARLGALRSLGVRTALDDFQVGHGSLSRLRELPLDLVKVDPQAVDGEPERPLVDVVVSLARRLGLEVVAEGLESPGQADRAHRAGCPLGQGFALSRPATAERVEAFLEEFPSPGAFA